MTNINFKNEAGLDPTAQEERDGGKYKRQMEKHKLSRQPAIVQTAVVCLIAILVFIANYSSIINQFGLLVLDLTGLQIKTLFFISFALNLLFGGYAFLMNYWSAFIIHKIIYAKLFRKRVMICRGEDKIFRFLVVDKTAKTYRVDDIGEWKINKNAMGWLENGLIMALCKEGFAEMIDLDDIEAKYALTVDENVFEDRIRNVKLESQLENSSVMTAKNMLFLIPLVLVIGVAAYLVLGQMQNGTCQAELVDLAKTCGQTVHDTTTEAAKNAGQSMVDKMPVINKIV